MVRDHLLCSHNNDANISASFQSNFALKFTKKFTWCKSNFFLDIGFDLNHTNSPIIFPRSINDEIEAKGLAISMNVCTKSVHRLNYLSWIQDDLWKTGTIHLLDMPNIHRALSQLISRYLFFSLFLAHSAGSDNIYIYIYEIPLTEQLRLHRKNRCHPLDD